MDKPYNQEAYVYGLEKLLEDAGKQVGKLTDKVAVLTADSERLRERIRELEELRGGERI